MDKIKLTPKQERFCQVYIETGNASEAYRQAYNASRTKPEVVAVKASQMLANGKVAVRIDALRAELKQRHVVTIDRVLEEYAKLAFFDARKLFDDNGAVLPVSQWPDDAAAAIGGLDVSEIGLGDGDALGMVKKLKLIDKRGALDSLARHLGMFVDKQEVSVVQPPKIIVELSNE